MYLHIWFPPTLINNYLSIDYSTRSMHSIPHNHSLTNPNIGLTHFGRIRMVMPALASASAHTASIVILLLYLALVIISGIKLALMEDGTVAPPVHWLRAWGVVAVSCHTILYLPALSILFSAMHCGIVYFTGTHFLPLPTLVPNYMFLPSYSILWLTKQ